MAKKTTNERDKILEQLPKLNCGACGYKSCEDLATAATSSSDEIKKCVNLAKNSAPKAEAPAKAESAAAQKPAYSQQRTDVIGRPVNSADANSCNGCAAANVGTDKNWKDTLSREFDFVLETFPGEPGPRETILPHNPALTKELGMKKGDIMIGRPLGMSCGCPITHCGVVMEVDYKTGVMVWCVTGPLTPRAQGYKDIGYYIAEAYEGIIKDSRMDLKIGMRYWFLPRRCMLQWRHSGLINFMNKIKDGYQVRIEGLLIG